MSCESLHHCHDGWLSANANALTVAPHININHIIIIFSYAPLRMYLESNTISLTMRATLQITRSAYENESEWRIASNGRTIRSIHLFMYKTTISDKMASVRSEKCCCLAPWDIFIAYSYHIHSAVYMRPLGFCNVR